jgi:hypothetical protein
MLTINPFALLSEVVPAYLLQIYIAVMIIAVAVGTLFDAYHKGSAKYFAQRRAQAAAAARKSLGGGEKVALAACTIGEAAVSGEFCKWPRRASHLLMMYGFITYVATTVIMVFCYPAAAQTPAILPALWTLGALMVLLGGLWFFFVLRVNVAYDGDSPWHVGRADLFILGLLTSAGFGLVWKIVQAAAGNSAASLTFFAIYIACTTFLFLAVPWSKFAHMFYKPVVAFQRRVEEANGSSDLPTPEAGRISRS